MSLWCLPAQQRRVADGGSTNDGSIATIGQAASRHRNAMPCSCLPVDWSFRFRGLCARALANVAPRLRYAQIPPLKFFHYSGIFKMLIVSV